MLLPINNTKLFEASIQVLTYRICLALRSDGEKVGLLQISSHVVLLELKEGHYTIFMCCVPVQEYCCRYRGALIIAKSHSLVRGLIDRRSLIIADGSGRLRVHMMYEFLECFLPFVSLLGFFFFPGARECRPVGRLGLLDA